MLQRIGALFYASWYWILLFAAMAVLVFFLLQFQAGMREHMTGTIEELLRKNPKLCLERLNNNRRLKLLFRKPVMKESMSRRTVPTFNGPQNPGTKQRRSKTGAALSC